MKPTNEEIQNLIDLAEQSFLPWELEKDLHGMNDDKPYNFNWVWDKDQKKIVTSGAAKNPTEDAQYFYLVAAANLAADLAREVIRLRQEVGDLIVE